MTRDLPPGVGINDLRTLTMVCELRSFSGAAVRLGINQSAVSYTIEKLRRAFDDPLFYRQSGKVIPTDRCQVLAQQAAIILETFSAMIEPESFDPKTARDTIRIACNYYERQIILPRVLKEIRQAAPGLHLELINATHRGPALLKSGEADLLMGPIRPDEAAFYCRTLLQEHYACIMDRENPLGAGLSLEQYVACNHVTTTYGEEWRSQYLIWLERAELQLNEVLKVPSPAGLDRIIAGTDMVATVPSRVAQLFEQRLVTTPCPCTDPFEICLVWTARTHDTPMHSWLRDLVFETARRFLR